MPHDNPTEDAMAALLRAATTIAVVGCSPKPERASHQVAAYLLAHGFQVIPVYPREEYILGRKVYRSLQEIPEKVDIVDVFRRAEHTPPIAEAAVEIGAGALWLQQGIVSEQAWHIADAAAMPCIMDRCIAVMHRLLLRQ